MTETIPAQFQVLDDRFKYINGDYALRVTINGASYPQPAGIGRP